MKDLVILYWPKDTKNDNNYLLARKTVIDNMGIVPSNIIGDIDLENIYNKNQNTVVFFPVFYDSVGWWGELLGADFFIIDKLIISAECQLMVIKSSKNDCFSKQNKFLAAEINPSSGFFNNINTDVATVVDMLATNSGNVLALFNGKNQNKFIDIIETTGNSYLGCIGGF